MLIVRLVFLLLALTALDGCITYNPRDPIPVIDDGPLWVSTALDQAVSFWNTHDLKIQRANHGIRLIVGLRYNTEPSRATQGQKDAGQYWYDDSTLRLGEWLESQVTNGQAGCVIAHEIGHAIAMGGINVHTSPGSLMTGDGRIMSGDHCSWSNEDQAALDRLRKQ